jgi:hypothetical protein
VSEANTQKTAEAKSRRETLKKIARFGAVSAPAVTLLLAASSKPAVAAISTV